METEARKAPGCTQCPLGFKSRSAPFEGSCPDVSQPAAVTSLWEFPESGSAPPAQQLTWELVRNAHGQAHPGPADSGLWDGGCGGGPATSRGFHAGSSLQRPAAHPPEDHREALSCVTGSKSKGRLRSQPGDLKLQTQVTHGQQLSLASNVSSECFLSLTWETSGTSVLWEEHRKGCTFV